MSNLDLPESAKDSNTVHQDKRISRRKALRLGGTLTSAALAAPAFLSACGGTGSLVSDSSSSSSSTKTLRVYWNPGHAYKSYQQVIDKFEQDHAGWKVK